MFHVHDEAVMEVPDGQGSVEEACRIMAIPPDWARDLPLRAGGRRDGILQKDMIKDSLHHLKNLLVHCGQGE